MLPTCLWYRGLIHLFMQRHLLLILNREGHECEPFDSVVQLFNKPVAGTNHIWEDRVQLFTKRAVFAQVDFFCRKEH